MKKTITFVLCVILVFFVNANMVFADPIVEYFPVGMFDRYGIKGNDNWFANALQKFNEPSIYGMELEEYQSVYRFTRMKTWASPPLIITVTIDHIKMTGTAVMSANAEIYSFYEDNYVEVNLNSYECKLFLDIIESNGFFEITPSETLEVLEDGTVVEVQSNGGEEILLEGKHADRYHAVARWSPGNNANRVDADNIKTYEISKYFSDLANQLRFTASSTPVVQEEQVLTQPREVVGTIVFPTPEEEYFHPNVFDRYGENREHRVNSFSRTLWSASEPSIYNMAVKENQSIYRFFCGEELWATVTIVRVMIDNDTMTGVATIKTWGPFDYPIMENESGFSIDLSNPNYLERTFEMDSKRCEELLALLEENDFWEIPPSETFDITSEGSVISWLGLDGEQWLIEGKQGDRHHVVYRWSPYSNARRYDPDNIKVYRIGSWLKDLTRI